VFCEISEKLSWQTIRDLSKHLQPQWLPTNLKISQTSKIRHLRRKLANIYLKYTQFSVILTCVIFTQAGGVLWDLGKIFSTNNPRLVKTFMASMTSQKFENLLNFKNQTFEAVNGRYILKMYKFGVISTFVIFTQAGGVLWDLGKFFSTNKLRFVKTFLALQKCQDFLNSQNPKTTHLSPNLAIFVWFDEHSETCQNIDRPE